MLLIEVGAFERILDAELEGPGSRKVHNIIDLDQFVEENLRQAYNIALTAKD